MAALLLALHVCQCMTWSAKNLHSHMFARATTSGTPSVGCNVVQGLTEAGAASLAQCLAVHPALRSLALGKNDIGDHGLSALSNAPWKRLEQLDLASCGITHTVRALIVGS